MHRDHRTTKMITVTPSSFSVAVAFLDPEWLANARSNGEFPGPDGLLQGANVAPFKTKDRDGTSVHRIAVATGQVLYLKRYRGPTWRRVVKRIITRQWPASTASDEYRAAITLRAAGLPVMNVVGWGEQRVLGLWPRMSFILSEAARGTDLTIILRSTHRDAARRKRLLTACGELAGEMHGKGLFWPFRPSDLLCVERTGQEDLAARLSIIDPDVKGELLTHERFTEERASSAIAYTFYMSLRLGLHLSDSDEFRVFLRSYRQRLGTEGASISARFANRILSQLDRLLFEHHCNPELTRVFPYLPLDSKGAIRASGTLPAINDCSGDRGEQRLTSEPVRTT